jgi:tetratricopeptide (TPR) repeat protein
MLMSNGLRRQITVVLLLLVLFTTAAVARADARMKSAGDTPRQEGKGDAASDFQQALEYQRAGRYREAIELYQRVIQLTPNAEGAYYNMGLAYASLGQLREALEAFRQTINIDPKHYQAYWAAGNLYVANRQYEEAATAYERSLSIKPDFADSYIGLGNARYGQRQYREALGDFNRALQLEPDNGFAYRGLGLTYYSMKQFADALSSLQRAAQVTPNDPDVYDLMGAIYNELGRPEDAVAASRHAIGLRPNDASASGSYISLSWYYSFSDQYQDSLDAARRAASLDPKQQMAFTNMCRALNDLGRSSDALAACQRALELKPGDGETLYYQGIAYGKLGQKQKALELYRQSAAAFERDANDQTDYYYLRGNVYRQIGRDADAIEAYRTAILQRPNFAQARLNLGLTYAAAGNRRAAMEEYNQLRQIDPARAEKLLRVIEGR